MATVASVYEKWCTTPKIKTEAEMKHEKMMKNSEKYKKPTRFQSFRKEEEKWETSAAADRRATHRPPLLVAERRKELGK